MVMKTKWIIIGMIIVWLLTIKVIFSIGYDAGENSSNLDEVYANYLDSILPESNEFAYITLSNGSYYVHHNCNDYIWEQLSGNFDYTLPLWSTQHFNDKPIFHLPRGGIIITNITFRQVLE